MDSDTEIETLREQVKSITSDIMRNVQKRQELARKIGEIKNRRGIEVRDEKVERDVKTMVSSVADEIGMDTEFALRLLNILLDESESVQTRNRQQPKRMTHLGIFMKAKQLEASGKEIIHLEVGEPDYPPPSVVGDSLTESFKLGRYHYTETSGIAKLREAIGKKEKTAVEKVIVTPGGRFAVFSAIVSTLKPGNELIVIEPAWPAYKECADFVGAKTRDLSTRLEDGWTPDLSQLEDMVGPSTKMIVLNYPNNPTGKILGADVMAGIVEVARAHNLYLLSDEVYADYSFGARFKSILEFDYERAIMVSSFSKRYGMTGFRVGYGIAQSEVVKRMVQVQAVGITSVAEPMQYAALAAIGEPFDDNVRVMKERLDLVCSRLKDMSLRFVKPDGAMYVFPELTSGDDMAVVDKLLERGVAVAPGSGFGDSYKKHIRISACRPVEVLERGLDTISSLLRETG